MNLFFLRQATASQTRLIGVFVDDNDFKTLETALTIANTDVKLSANGAASANKNFGGGTHRVNGCYAFTFDATDTATVGDLHGSIAAAGALPVLFRAVVLEEAVYDALFVVNAPGYGVAQTGDSYARLPSDPADASVVAELISAVEGKVDAVKAKTDSLTFTVAGKLDVNVLRINGVAVIGAGTSGNLWRA